MGFLSKVKSFFTNKDKINVDYESLEKFINNDIFISRKHKNNYISTIENYDTIIGLDNKKNIKAFCSSNDLDYHKFNEYLNEIKKLDELVKKHNEEYVSRHLIEDKEYLDGFFKNIDPNIILDEEQRKAILRDEDYTLIVAGAGSGKTTTISAKVKYLVEKRKLDPKEILIISYTNKAVDELKERINNQFKIKCPIATFHSTGNAIIRKKCTESKRIVSEGFLFNCMKKFLNGPFLFDDDKLAHKAVLFFSYYLDYDNIKTIEDVKSIREYRRIETLKSQLSEVAKQEIAIRENMRITINTEIVRSIEEAKIANFLYLNGIKYDYEKPYPIRIEGMRRPYLPDFTIYNGDDIIYLEHFGISEDRKHSMYSEEIHKKYCSEIDKKIALHKNNNTDLIYTYSHYSDERDFLEDLEEKLKEKGVEFNKRDPKEICIKLSRIKDNKIMLKMIKLLITFINNFKSNGWNEEYFDVLYSKNTSERNRVFLEIARKAYVFYQNELSKYCLFDFQDLINESKSILDSYEDMKDILPFKYIIIDEYQDISLQRFNLTKKLSEITDAKIIAVGDDWQSIYAFAGSKIKLFTDFEKMMTYSDKLEITHTYRNSQELIDIAGNFIQKNDEQFKKTLKSPKNIKYPVVIFSYNDDQTKNEKKGTLGILYEKAEAIERALDAIVKRNNKEDSKILLLGRYGFDGERLAKTPFFNMIEREDGKSQLVSAKYPKLDIEFLTAHSSKGLGRDEVIIINAENGTYGFPSQKTNDPVLNMVIYNDNSYEDAEERRLFYVAMTRTKNRVYIIAPKYSPSKFLLELIEEKNVFKDWPFNEIKNVSKKLGSYCPHCGFPLYYKDSIAFGKKMYVCSNDPEVCGFVSNNMKGGKTSIKKCPICDDGYLFIKKVRDKESYFLGCSNYRSDGKGCNYAEPLDWEN